MKSDSQAQASPPSDPIAQNIIGQTNDMRELLRQDWVWPSPQGGFTALVLPSFDFALESNSTIVSQLKRGEAPLLSAIGYGLFLSQNLRNDASLLATWREGMTRLSLKDAFPIDRESFVFRPVELFGIALGVKHCPGLPDQITTWFSHILNSAIERNIFADSWANLLGELTALEVGVRWPSKPVLPFDNCDLETSALWLWIHQGRVTNEEIDALRARLLREYIELVEPPHSYQALTVIYSQLAPIVKRSIQQFSATMNQMVPSQEVETMQTTQQNPRVFITYSHDKDVWKAKGADPETQRKRVFALAQRLRDEGVECMIDQHIVNPPEGWQRWMMNNIEGADFVLVVATETYDRRFRGKEDPNKGAGSQWEGAIVTQELYNQNGKNEKFIPVIFERADAQHIPLPLQSATYHDVSSNEGYDELYYYLTNQPPYVPTPLGQIRKRPAN